MRYQKLWILNTDLTYLDNILIDNNELLNERNVETADVWFRIEEVIQLAQQLNPLHRKKGEITRFKSNILTSEVNGTIKIAGLFERATLQFSTETSFISGKLRILEEDSRRPALVDVMRGNQEVSSVLAPIGLFSELPFQENLITRLKDTLNKKKKAKKFQINFYMGIGVITWSVLLYIERSNLNAGNILLSTIFSILVSFTSKFLLKKIDSFINTFKTHEDDKLLRPITDS